MADLQFETFRDIGSHEASQLKQPEPSCFTGMVRVVKYRVTVEEVVEPKEVIVARLRKLWAECDNHHHRRPLLAMAAKYGVDLREQPAQEGGAPTTGGQS